MSNTIEWFDLVELDEMVRQSNYFANYTIDMGREAWIDIYLEKFARVINLNKLMEDLLAFKAFFAHAESVDFSIEKKCMIIKFNIEQIKGYAQHSPQSAK